MATQLATERAHASEQILLKSERDHVLIAEASVDEIVGGIGRALAAYAHPRFAALRRRVMRLDVSWDRPGRR